jgi:hypothetical protein
MLRLRRMEGCRCLGLGFVLLCARVIYDENRAVVILVLGVERLDMGRRLAVWWDGDRLGYHSR